MTSSSLTTGGSATPRRRNTLLFIIAVLSVLFAGLSVAFVATRDHRQLPAPSAIGGPFSLTAADGRTITDQTYAGKWELIYFGYTFCPDACPTALSDISAALAAIGSSSAQFQPLFITVDPKRDTQVVLAEYLKSFDPRLVGLTGPLNATQAAAAAYHVYVNVQGDGAASGLIDHSAYVYVMDPEGRFVDVIDGSTPGKEFAGKLRTMMDQYL